MNYGKDHRVWKMIANGIAMETCKALEMEGRIPRCVKINNSGKGKFTRGFGTIDKFTLPYWIFEDRLPFFYLVYYVAHEVCHHFVLLLHDHRTKYEVHGEEFMALEEKAMRYFGIKCEYYGHCPYPKRLRHAGQTLTRSGRRARGRLTNWSLKKKRT
jgi:hypothetical protein